MIPQALRDIISTVRRGYASGASVAAQPVEPPDPYFTDGAQPQETLPTPFWNFLMQIFLNNSDKTRTN